MHTVLRLEQEGQERNGISMCSSPEELTLGQLASIAEMYMLTAIDASCEAAVKEKPVYLNQHSSLT